MSVITEHRDNFYAFQFMSFKIRFLKPAYAGDIQMPQQSTQLSISLGRSSLLSPSPKAAMCRGWISSQFRQEHRSTLCSAAPGVGDGLLKIQQPSQPEEQPVAEELILYLLTRKTYLLTYSSPPTLPILQ